MIRWNPTTAPSFPALSERHLYGDGHGVDHNTFVQACFGSGAVRLRWAHAAGLRYLPEACVGKNACLLWDQVYGGEEAGWRDAWLRLVAEQPDLVRRHTYKVLCGQHYWDLEGRSVQARRAALSEMVFLAPLHLEHQVVVACKDPGDRGPEFEWDLYSLQADGDLAMGSGSGDDPVYVFMRASS
jgi:hypothetical protein